MKRANSTTVKNISIVEDLGMLHYIFTDKTGTLTRNQMEFHSMCVGKEIFDPKDGLEEGEELDEHAFDLTKIKDTLQGKRLGSRVNIFMESSN